MRVLRCSCLISYKGTGTHGTCNGGWMKRIDDRAKPILAPLIKGEYTVNNPTRIDPGQMATIATWAALKVMIAEFDEGNQPLTHRYAAECTCGTTKRPREKIGASGSAILNAIIGCQNGCLIPFFFFLRRLLGSAPVGMRPTLTVTRPRRSSISSLSTAYIRRCQTSSSDGGSPFQKGDALPHLANFRIWRHVARRLAD